MLLARFDRPLDLSRAARIALLGGKGEGLMRMAGELGLPVPPGFILTTRACALFAAQGMSDALERALREGMAELERATGRRFGDPAAPLLVSVRSGAPTSMPGMLDTILDVGLDASTTAALAQIDPRFAAECRARLVESFRASLDRDPPGDVWAQLRESVAAVFRSARSPRALAYRRREGIEGEPETAVTIQTMVFGNRDARSATGVFFTRDPATGEPRPYGDVLFEAQGEDVVSGRHATLPFAALAERLPDAARALVAIGERLERAHRDVCEIEFTIESGQLWLLQVRIGKRSPRAALRIAHDLAIEPGFPFDRREAVSRVRALLAAPPRERRVRDRSPSESVRAQAIARGIAASPGLATGELATQIEDALARASAGRAVLLVRPETSPEDVEGIACAAGLLTARGGLASHAAVVARGWGIPAVVGLAALRFEDSGIEVGGQRLAIGDRLTIDGSTGEVFAGAIEFDERVVPEAEPLLAWAQELGIEIAPPPTSPAPTMPNAAVGADSSAPSESALHPTSPPSEFDLIGVLSLKGSATIDLLAAALAIAPELAQPLLDALVAAGEAAPSKPLGHRLTDAGRARESARLEADRSQLGVEVARQALVDFQPFDTRMKEAVTDWQLRLEGEERVTNDHADPSWDANVLERIESVVADATRWLGPLAARLPRLARNALRLARALAATCAGDTRFVASPRVDSLHGIWFELHEDLIRLAASSRADERAAGRAG